jgi:pectate lyase
MIMQINFNSTQIRKTLFGILLAGILLSVHGVTIVSNVQAEQGWINTPSFNLATTELSIESSREPLSPVSGLSLTNASVPTFADVPFNHPLWAYIQALWDSGYTAGCLTNPLRFCPNQTMTRAESAVFMLRGQFGSDYSPPAAPWDTFADNWSPGTWAEKWAEGMWQEGMTAGCLTDPLRFCPWDLLPRVQAVIFGLRMLHGMAYTPSAATGAIFADMTDTGYYGTKWAEQAYADGLLPACSNDPGSGKPLFCPNDLVTRAWGAYLVVKAKDLPTPPPIITSLPAFLGAEGFGADSIGGRGGKVYEVTNTNDSGTGSLRSCVEASGPRICVFRTGGLITLNSPLSIKNPYITIAGQTAPGGGITIKLGSSTEIFLIKTHDVIIRYITARPGPGGENHGNQIAADGVELYNIMIDHNTYSWGVDSNIETWYRVVNTTIQWSIISEPLDCSTHSQGCHSKGIMIGGFEGGEGSNTKGSENISVLQNLIAHYGERGPLVQACGIVQIVNNISYNPLWTFAHQQLNCPNYASYVNWIGNYHKRGPDSTSNTDLKVIPADNGTMYAGKVYVQGNIGPSRATTSQPDSDWVNSGSRSFLVTVPAIAPIVTTTDALTAYNSVLANAGNNAGLNCDGTWFARRDSIDTRIVNEVINGTGHIIDNPSEVGGWITPAAGTPCMDSDHDGMPDVWELAHGLNPTNAADGSQISSSGYTYLEEFLNGPK